MHNLKIYMMNKPKVKIVVEDMHNVEKQAGRWLQ